ncbi:MAG: hypothetical protein JNM72_09940 [Deltaproteobacteria bacterium]|nr:hypothetical protein [Deltaproteobacteria bacterium]
MSISADRPAAAFARPLGGLISLIAAGLGAQAGWAWLMAGQAAALALPVPWGWWPIPSATVVAAMSWLPSADGRRPVEAAAAMLSALSGALVLILGGLAAGWTGALHLLGAALVLIASAPRAPRGWLRVEPLAAFGALLWMVTALTSVVELSRVAARWVEVQAHGVPTPEEVFPDGRSLPQAPSTGLRLRWVESDVLVELPERRRPAPVDDGDAALGPERAPANVVLIVDLADARAPDWLDLVDVVQDARRTAARIVVKVTEAPGCEGANGCGWAALHYCATEQRLAWDLLDLRAADAALRTPPADLASRLGLDEGRLQSCLASRPAGQAGARAAAAIRVMKREGGPWLDVEGFGWTGEPPDPGDVISVIDAVIGAYRGGAAVQPRRLRPRWEGEVTQLPVAVPELRPAASAGEAARACAEVGAQLCGIDALVGWCRGAAPPAVARRSGAARFRLPSVCAEDPAACVALRGAATLGLQPEWAWDGAGAVAVAGGPGCLEAVGASSAALPFRCCRGGVTAP